MKIRFGTGANYAKNAAIRRGDLVKITPGLGVCRVIGVTSTRLTVRACRRWRWTESLIRWFEDTMLFPLEDFLVAVADELGTN